jgi:hypothetical protein
MQETKSHLCTVCIRTVPYESGSPLHDSRQRIDCPAGCPIEGMGGCSDQCRLTHACGENHLAQHIYGHARFDECHRVYLAEHYRGAPCAWCGRSIVDEDDDISFSCPRNNGSLHSFWVGITRDNPLAGVPA